MSVLEYLVLEDKFPCLFTFRLNVFAFVPGMENDEILLSPSLSITCSISSKNDKILFLIQNRLLLDLYQEIHAQVDLS